MGVMRMEFGIGLLIAAGLGFGLYRFVVARSRQEADRKTRADRRAKIARDDTKAIQRAIDGRR